jgi:hypothetical protein
MRSSWLRTMRAMDMSVRSHGLRSMRCGRSKRRPAKTQGGWRWQNFHLAPWESAESGYQGAALLFLEALSLPDGFVTEPVARQHLDELRHYLRRKYAVQPVINQLYILWASARAPGLLTQPERKALVASIERQQQADGGWRTMTMAKSEWTEALPRPTESDGYATGLTVLALEESGAGRDEMTLQRGLKWLTEHQERDGSWSAGLDQQEARSADRCQSLYERCIHGLCGARAGEGQITDWSRRQGAWVGSTSEAGTFQSDHSSFGYMPSDRSMRLNNYGLIRRTSILE